MYKPTKENWELLIRARDYVEAVLDEWETSEDYEYTDHEPTFHLTEALDALNKVIAIPDSTE